MAIIICRECGKNVSDKALRCPHCGVPLQRIPVGTRNPGYTTREPVERRSNTLLLVIIAILSAVLLSLLGYLIWRNLSADKGVAGFTDSDDPILQQVISYSNDSIREHEVWYKGKRTIRLEKDQSFSFPADMNTKTNCFLVASKKDYYLYVYEAQGGDTVLLARYDCAFGLNKGDKETRDDEKTPNSTMESPFTVKKIENSSKWRFDFGDGRGQILAYGRYCLRLDTPGFDNIGIIGSTNNEEIVPGRASSGCIQLRDNDNEDLGAHYAFQGMKVVVKDEYTDDYDFEIRAQVRQAVENQIVRRRHLDPKKVRIKNK